MAKFQVHRKWILLAVLLLLSGALSFFLPLGYVPSPEPQPNGYHDLQRAATMIAKRTAYYEEMEEEELQQINEQNQEGLALAREALQHECAVPMDWSKNAQWMDQATMDRGSALRNVARAFAAEALQAKQEDDINLVVQCAMDCMQLAVGTGNGGLMLDWMIAQAIDQMGTHILQDQIGSLTGEQCQRILKTMDKTVSMMDQPTEVLTREQAYFRHTHGLQGAAMQLLLRSQIPQIEKQAEESAARRLFARSLLRTHLAIRQFQLGEARLPNDFEELVPQYLAKVPMDADGKGELTYQLNGDSYLIFDYADEHVEEESESSE